MPYAKPDEVSPTPWYTLVLDLKKHTSSPLVGTLRVYSPYSANYAGWKDRYQNWKPRLQTWPQPQKYSSQRRKSTSMFPWLKTRGCEVTLHFTTYRFQVAEIIGTWDAGQHTHFFVQRPLVLHLPVCHVLFSMIPAVQLQVTWPNLSPQEFISLWNDLSLWWFASTSSLWYDLSLWVIGFRVPRMMICKQPGQKSHESDKI